jgi:hypothetical protein
MRLGRALAAFRIPVAILRGPARPARPPITLVTAGAEPWVRFLTSRYFSSPPQREEVGPVAPWRLPPLLERMGASADLVVALLDRAWSRSFFGPGFLVVPATLGSSGKVPDDPERALQANPELASDMRRLRRNAFVGEISHSEADLDAFYDSMYVPFMQSRHGEFAFIQPRSGLRRAFRRGGGIVWIRRGTERIAGGLFQQRRDVLRLSASAIAGGDAASIRAGASAALYFHRIRLAHARGCTRVDFGGSPPILGDGLLRYKRKWGARLNARPESRSDYLLSWTRPNEHVLDFLAHTPLIFRHRRQLAAVTALDPASADGGRQASQTLRASWMPGLQRVVVMVPRDLAGARASLPESLPTRLGDEGCEVVSCEAEGFLERYGRA